MAHGTEGGADTPPDGRDALDRTPAPSGDVAPLHGDDPVRVRLARHAVGITLLTGGAVLMGLVGVYPPSVPWWLPAAVMVVVSVLIAAVYARNPGASARERNLRAAVQAVALTAVTYATGWGFALPFVHLFGIADNVNESGPRAGRTALSWSVATTAVAQLGVQAGLVPLAAVAARASHLIAGVTLVLLTLVTRRLQAAEEHRRTARAALASSERRFRTLVEDATDVILLLDRELVVTYASPAVRAVLGVGDAAVVGTTYLDLVAPGDVDRVASSLADFLAGGAAPVLVGFEARHADGHAVAVQAGHRDLLEDPDVRALVVSLRDVSERVRLEAEVEHGRSHDAVTGLPNRGWLEERADEVLADSSPEAVGMLALGVTGLDAVVDAAGRQRADAVMALLADELSVWAGDGHLLARVAENRFAVVASGVDGIAALHTVADELRALIGREVDAGTVEARLHAAVGIAPATAGDTGQELLRAAELALRAAATSESGIVRFDESLHERTVERLRAERELALAVARDEFVLHFQPLVSLTGGPDVVPTLVGVEALVRWQHPERGLVPPGLFVPLAEETGLVIELGWWVLDAALDQLAAWDAALGVGTVGYVSVNVSMLQFATGELAERVDAALDRTGIAPSRLLLELTETSLAEDPTRTVPQLSMLAAMGVGLAIDDFGTGYSSMQYLQQFPVDVLKIDRAFVAGASPTNRSELLASLRHLGEVLGLRTVAEGIETDEELQAVRELRFHVGQGYLFGRPVTADELGAAVSARLASGAGPVGDERAPAAASSADGA